MLLRESAKVLKGRRALSYVGDVSYYQSFLQAMFGVSSVTISPTNGNKIVLSNISDGAATRDAIWKLVLSKFPNRQPIRVNGLIFQPDANDRA